MKRIIRIRKRSNNNPLDLTGRIIHYIVEKPIRLTQEQIEKLKEDFMGIKGITKGRLLKKYKITIDLKAELGLTKKGILVRMGKGKGKHVTNIKFLTQGMIVAILKSKGTKPIITKDMSRILTKYSFLTIRAI